MNKSIQRYFITCILLMWGLQSFSCTTFLISGKSTVDGKPILFKNRDTDKLQNSLAFFNDGKYNYIGVVDGTDSWNKAVWGGYNETGFAIINSAAYNNNLGDTSTLMDQEGIIMKLALQTCKTLSDFEELLTTLKKPMGLDANFGVIDAFGGAAYYETGNFKFTKFDVNDPAIAPDGILVRTNYSKSADTTKGFGYCRYTTALNSLHKAASTKQISAQYLFNNISRNLTHSLTNTNLLAYIPKQKDVKEFKFFIDFIPRFGTASSFMIIGAKDDKHYKNTMMWTILGFPLTSVAIPTWIAAGSKLPKAVRMSEQFKSPICSAALRFKDDCFPLKYENGGNYINLSAVVNQQHTGYMQLLQPVENVIFERANLLQQDIDSGAKIEKDIQVFYSWLDQFLAQNYKEKFKFNLFDN